jgi:hypothetical protein
LNLLIDTIPLLCRSKPDVLLFFKGAGVGADLTGDFEIQVEKDPDSVKKREIVRGVLTRLNQKGEPTLRDRREILKRVTEFEDFSTCWPEDQLKAKGLVAEIRRVINVKDAFTRINLEREEESKKHREEHQAKIRAIEEHRNKVAAVKRDLYALFVEPNPHKRGKALEGVLNRLFEASGILVREAFALRGSEGEGIVQQIDGVVEIDGGLYLVEMKWLSTPVDVPDVSHHLVRVFSRGDAKGIFISASDYTKPAVSTCRDSLSKMVVVLCNLEEFTKVLEQELDLKQFFKAKIRAAVVDKNPLHDPFGPEGFR